MTTPILLAALSAAPTWALILMAIIIVVLIILLRKELWSLFTKIQTGIILLIILTLMSTIGGLLPQHLTQADVTQELLGLPLPEAADVDKASELMKLPPSEQVTPSMMARMFGYVTPEEISDQAALKLMGTQPPPGMSINDAYIGWVKEKYDQAVIAKYSTWFDEKFTEREQPFKTFYKIGFFRIYHTWYYLLVAYLLFICAICCTIQRLSGFLRMRRRGPQAYPEERLKRQIEFNEFGFKAGELRDADNAAQALSTAGLHPKVCSKDKGYQFNLDFGFRFPRTVSSVVFHLALVLALIGFIMTGFYSWRISSDSFMLGIGETKDVKLVNPDTKMYKWWDSVYRNRGAEWANPEKRYDLNASFQVRCDDYFSEYIPDEKGDWYTLKDYKSDLTIIDNGREVKSKRIEVNYPLIYRSIDFFQENVTQQGKLVITPPLGDVMQVEATIWGTKLPKIEALGALTGSSLVWGKLVTKGGEEDIGPKIRIGKKMPPKIYDWPNPGKPKSGMGQGMGMGMEGMGVQETEWLFVVEDGKPAEYQGYKFELKGPYEKGTGLQVVHDPGVPILWVSIIVIIVMLVFGVYFPHYTARVDVSSSPDGKQRLIVAGRAYGLGSNFRKQAERIASVLKK